jgi:tetratricopeptide (TPR) repeat protein
MMLKLTGVLLALSFLGGCASMIEPPARRAPVEDLSRPVTPAPVEVGPQLPAEAEPASVPLQRAPLPPSGPPVLGPPVPETLVPGAPVPEALVPERSTTATTASGSLLESVDAALAAGELDRAAALAERALRITPRDGQLWLKLGTIRQRQGRTADARGFAQRALSLAAGDAQLERQSRILLELLALDEE